MVNVIFLWNLKKSKLKIYTQIIPWFLYFKSIVEVVYKQDDKNDVIVQVLGLRVYRLSVKCHASFQQIQKQQCYPEVLAAFLFVFK